VASGASHARRRAFHCGTVAVSMTASIPTPPTEAPRRGRRRPFRDRWTTATANLVLRRPGAILAISITLAIAGAVIAWRSLSLDADTNSLIAADRPFMKLYRSFLEEFGDLEYITVVVDGRPDGGEDPDGSKAAIADQAVDRLLETLSANEALPAVHGRLEPNEQLRIATRVMAIEDLEGLASARRALPALASGDAGVAIRQAGQDLSRLLGQGLLLDDAARRELAAGAILVLEQAAAASPAASAGDRRTLATPPPAEYLRSETGRLSFVTILPQKDFNRLDAIREPLAAIRAAIDEVRAEFPQLEIGLTGKPVLQADELETTDRDMVRSASVAAAIIAGLFMAVFRGVRRPLLAVAAFAIAFGWSYGVATLAVGHLNLLSIVFMLVLVGVGLDYGVHVVARFMEARRRRLASGAIRETMRTAVPGNITGSLTSAAVFLLALTTNFQGLRELGLIAGAGLLLCVIAMTIDLPALLWLTERRGRAATRLPRRVDPTAPVEPLARRRPTGRWFDALLAGVAVAIAAVAVAAAARSLRFESNLLDLQADGLESVDWEHRVFEDSVSASWFGASIAESFEAIESRIESAMRHAEIARTVSVLDVIERPDARRDAARAAFRAAVDAVSAEEADAAAVATDDAIATELAAARDRLAALAQAARGSAPEEGVKLAALADRLAPLVAELRSASSREVAASRVRTAFGGAAAAIAAMAEGDRAELREALPAAIRDSLVAPSGRFLVRMLPAEDAWEIEPLGRFVAAMRSVDPMATGVPMTQFESIHDMSQAFVQMAILALVAVTVLVWIDFRDLSSVVVCIAALLLGLAWTVGAMTALGVPLNLANFFGIPILMGLGIDSAVHMTHRARESRGRRIRYGATAKAVALTATTTAIGFGSLVFASHRGLQSLGMVMLLGSLACLAAAVLFVPAAVRLLGWERRDLATPAEVAR
jgi:predicted RND superfamily exporter protein